MSYALVISGRDQTARLFSGLDGQPILAGFPGRVLLFVGEENVHLPSLPNCTVEVIEYMAKDRMIEVARRYQGEHGLSSVSTLDERSIELAAELREALGVPGLSRQEARLYRDKVLMKERLASHGIRVPEFCTCTDEAAVRDLLARRGRIVIKPRDGIGSKHVSFADSQGELDQWFAHRREWSEFEAEEYIEGTLYHTNSVVVGGKVEFTAIAPYLPGMANIDYTCGAPFVSLMETGGALHKRLEAFSVEVIAAFGLRDGVTHLEVFHAPDDTLVFCEMAIRPGGGGIVQMIEAQHGVNLSLAALMIDAGLGGNCLSSLRNQPQQVGLIGLRNATMGRVELDDDVQHLRHDWVRFLNIDVVHGQFRAPSSHCTDYTALVIIQADDATQFHHRLNEVQSHFDRSLRLAPL